MIIETFWKDTCIPFLIVDSIHPCNPHFLIIQNNQTTDFLIDFTLEKIDDNKSWNIAYDLNQIGKILFRENHIPHLKKLECKNIDDFVSLKNQLK